NDRASLTANYLDASGNSLGSDRIGNVLAVDRTNHTALLYRGGTNAVPAGTRKIQVVLSMINDSGAYYNDGYADNLSLVLRHENASLPIFDNSGGGDNGGIGFTETSWLASRFCLGAQAFDLDSLSMLLSNGSSTGQTGDPSTVRLQIFANDPVSGKPSVNTGVIMNLSGLTNPITISTRLVKWTPATPFRLSPNTCYWAVLSREGGGAIGLIASFSTPTGAAAALGKAQSNDAGVTWGIDPSFNFKMRIEGTPVPTPLPTAELIVPGTANPWLAGMTNGFAESSGDTTPANSPVLFSGFSAGMKLQFSVPETDRAGYQAGSESGPDGVPGFFVTHGAESGIGEIRGAQANALLGVFLNGNQPGAAPTPLPLDFTAEGARNFLELKPELNQPFYIGDGKTADEIAQTVIAPAGATRLFLGITDGAGWYNNSGAFHVTVKIVSPPSTTSVPPPDLAANGSTIIPAGTGAFTSFPFAPSLSGSDAAFLGLGNEGQQGIYVRNANSQITRIVDLNTPVPNGAGNFLSFGAQAGIIIVGGTEAGIIIVGGNVLFSGHGPDGQQGIYLADRLNPAAPIRIVDTSTANPGSFGNFTAFQDTLGFSGEQVVFGGSGFGGQQGIYAVAVPTGSQAGLPIPIADNATPLPGGSGNFTAFPSAPTVSGNSVAFIANGPDGQQGLYKAVLPTAGQSASLTAAADTSTAIPGGSGNFTAFGTDQEHPVAPAMQGDRLAFVGSGSASQQGIYTIGVSAPPQAGPARLADSSTAIPGGTGNFASFGAVSISDTDVAFLANGANGQQGIYAATSESGPFKVIDLHDKIAGKSIAGLNFSRTGLSGDPITFQATFTDGSQGIYTMDIVPPALPVRIVSAQEIGTDLVLSFTSNAGRSYEIQSRADVAAGEWTAIPGSPFAGTGADVQVSIPNAFAQARQFYRIKQLQ
ncbi:MAG TPA: choice-of-anchor R domain-containing protein, partial [Verrucomicrobiae bacterium]|nr:choice-of-anchor R domain-containing protein [Verrucomicrobiae bacterium]